VHRAALVLTLLTTACFGEASATGNDVVSQDVKAALFLAIDGDLTKPESLAETYRLVEKHPPADTLRLIVEALETHPRAALHLLTMLHWDHPEPALGPLRRLLVDKGPPFQEDRDGKGLIRVFRNIDRGILRGEAAMALASLGDAESYDEFLEMVEKDPYPDARQHAAWALGELGRTEAIEPLKAIAQTLAHDQESDIQSMIISGAVERLEFLRDHSGKDAATIAAARGVSRIAGWSEDQKRAEPALSSLRALEPALRTKLLEAWGADESRPTIARASRWALKQLEATK